MIVFKPTIIIVISIVLLVFVIGCGWCLEEMFPPSRQAFWRATRADSIDVVLIMRAAGSQADSKTAKLVQESPIRRRVSKVSRGSGVSFFLGNLIGRTK
jgi:hypothetical protein